MTNPTQSRQERIAELRQEIAEAEADRAAIISNAVDALSPEEIAGIALKDQRLTSLRAELSRLRNEHSEDCCCDACYEREADEALCNEQPKGGDAALYPSVKDDQTISRSPGPGADNASSPGPQDVREKVLSSFEIRQPDADGFVWLFFHGNGTVGKGAVNLGTADRIVAQVALKLEEDRKAALVQQPSDAAQPGSGADAIIHSLKEERDSWRRVAERLESEKQAQQSDAAQPAGWTRDYISKLLHDEARKRQTIHLGLGETADILWAAINIAPPQPAAVREALEAVKHTLAAYQKQGAPHSFIGDISLQKVHALIDAALSASSSPSSVGLVEAAEIYRKALQRISKSNLLDMNTLHPEGCAQVAAEALSALPDRSAT